MAANVIYSDFLLDFVPHPITGDIVRVINDAAVKSSVRNIVFTAVGERYFDNILLAGSIRRYLFEPMTPQTTFDIQQELKQAIYNYEPRIENLQVNVTPDFNNDAYNIVIGFSILNSINQVTLNITLKRLG